MDAAPPTDPELVTPPRRPIRLVVTDDLERSRLTVFFRILLALPHLVWVSLWGFAAFAVSIVVWLAVLVERRAPRTLHGFLASYVRYTTHVNAYCSLVANPYPGFTGKPGYPVDVEIDAPAPQGRWSAAFRLVLALPAILLAASIGMGVSGAVGGGWILSYGGLVGLSLVSSFLGWFACLARGRMPRGLRDVGAFAVGYAAQTYGYVFLLTDRYPCSDPALGGAPELPHHPVRVDVTDSLERPRLMVFFRLLLAFPHFLWIVLWTLAVWPVVTIAWLAAIAIGRVPRPLWRFLAAYVRYSAHLNSFVYMVGGPFPGFVGARGRYPIDIITDEPGRQHRLATLFRLVLAIPALLLFAAYGGVTSAIALLGWFGALFTGRMPAGMRDLGAASIRYTAQTQAYLLLVTDRYPHSAPYLRGDDRPEQLSLDLAPGGLRGAPVLAHEAGEPA